MSEVRLTVVGDPYVGKTSLLQSFAVKEITGEEVFFKRDCLVDTKTVRFLIKDAPCRRGFFSIRRMLMYPNTDCFIVCFSAGNPESFFNVTEKWLLEISHCQPGVPAVLVCCKKDLRLDQDHFSHARSGKEAIEEDIASELVGVNMDGTTIRSYFECSVAGDEGIEDVFSNAARQGLQYRQGVNER
mmetsp:Transcript_11046/g.12636  ORF Transcript_11046/g.12636 Transcript_11046/m.12636 type:complete len:186 (+) Transcript_11046:184-741(+)